MGKARDSIDLWFYERKAISDGHRIVAGVDEAGRGPLAGPVVASAVVLPFGCDILGIYDSKQLSPQKRDSAFDKIFDIAIAVGVGIVDAEEIDRLNILQATYRAMRIAISELEISADIYLVDGYPIRNFEHRQRGIIGGDGKSVSIAAASIVAKVTRDRIMCEYDEIWPQFGFAKHKGYPTEEHLQKLDLHGVCDIHRRSFAPVAERLSRQEFTAENQEHEDGL